VNTFYIPEDVAALEARALAHEHVHSLCRADAFKELSHGRDTLVRRDLCIYVLYYIYIYTHTHTHTHTLHTHTHKHIPIIYIYIYNIYISIYLYRYIYYKYTLYVM
jgi:hypothetical protein